ncbi:MAG: hypothetical protein LBC41_09830, partial [Clostridiales bacterium]|nr:hypothetical protein [Clostridiales bacterium]
MKRFTIAVMIAILLLTPESAFAAQEVAVTLNGEVQEFRVPPQIAQDRVMVPLRGLFEKLGLAVLWDPATKRVTAARSDCVVKIGIGEHTALVNKTVLPLDVPALIIDDATMVPLRFLSETLGAKVEWLAEDRTAVITADLPSYTPGALTLRDLLGTSWYLAGTETAFMFNPDDFSAINDNWPDGSDTIYYSYVDGTNVIRLVTGAGTELPNHFFTYFPNARQLIERVNGEVISAYSLDKNSAPYDPQLPPEPSPTPSPVPTPTEAAKTATLYAVFSESDDLMRLIEYPYDSTLDAQVLANGLSGATGLNFQIFGLELASDGLVVNWSSESTLLKGLTNEEPVFYFNDSDSLNWFMLDSLYYTLKENLTFLNIYYTSSNGNPLVVP